MAECCEGKNIQATDLGNMKIDNFDESCILTLKQKINQTKADVNLRFADIHNLLNIKENSIITKINELCEQFETRFELNCQELKQLQRAREESIQIVNLNTLSGSLEEVLSTIDSNINEINKSVIVPSEVKVLWRDEGLIDLIDNLCSIQKIEPVTKPDYEQRKKPFWSGCNRGTGTGEIGTSDIFRYGLGLDVDRDKRVYISDLWNHRILVFSNEGVYEREIGRDILSKPYSVHVNNDFVYVTEWGNDCVTEFNLLGNKMQRVGTHGNSHGKFNRPAGITTDERNVVYVCDRNNNRVQKFNKQLEWVETVRHQLMQDPSDVKVKNREIFVLATSKSSKSWFFDCCNTIFVLSIEDGELLRTISSKHVTSGRFFCLDNSNNILISDSQVGCVVVLSQEGELVAVLGDEVEEVTGRSYCYQSKGIAFNQDVIVNVCDKNINCLLMF
ncbi:hypothetical protein LOD99_1907 [Oopsacas minuta]|uniref:Uncharacterized protein n=1 Tax=Oopsacas minuta TaxID=111878 RepID=A0AAV7K596_9METZ|nr:hypothetical protein LOD99_1907 [Oopsacas minuta]